MTVKITEPGPAQRGALKRWQQRIECAPCIFARLVLLAAHRHPDTNQYFDPMLSETLGRQAADRYLRTLHEQVFREWLTYPLERQRQDLELYLASLPRPVEDVLRVWRRLKVHHTYAPELPDSPEVDQFAIDLDALVEVMWNEAAATGAAADDHENYAGDWRVGHLLRWIEERRGAPSLTLHQAAAKLRTSAQHLGRLFREQVGRSFKEHLRSVRLRNAVSLLANQELSVKEVATILGYSYQTHFTAEFRLAFGSSPRRYRHQLQPQKN